MKTINTLVKDIYDVIDGKGGWDETVADYFSKSISDVLSSRLNAEDQQERATLRLSNLGTPCQRKLWYTVNRGTESEALSPKTRFKFLYGDVLESLVLALVRAAGHHVTGEQEKLNVHGIVGHRDAVIDGITVDVKSASGRSFEKFASGQLREDDPFGYVSQLSSYVYGGRYSDVQSHPTIGAFLVVNKENGEICLDVYDFKSELEAKATEIENLKQMVATDKPPGRRFAPVPDGSSGNMKLGVNCSYCNFKKTCWPDHRTFIYSNGPRFLVDVKRLPNVPEVT
jgi:hypothetical protein